MKAIIAFAISVVISLVIIAAPPKAAVAEPVQQSVIGPDDVLTIVVVNHEELNRDVTVLEDGTITLAEVGKISVAGKTPEEVAEIIKTKLSRTRKLVEVFVSAKEVHSRNVRILGTVKVPGPYEIKPDWRAMDLVDAAGGLTLKSTRVTAKIVRNHSQIIPIDIQKADTRRDSEWNVVLMRDDELILEEIEATHPQVIVLGNVVKPGVYELDDQTTVISILTQAGGANEKASLSNAYVTRNGKMLMLNLSSTEHGVPDLAVASFKFMPGDILYIPENLIHINVMGAVGKPGPYPLPESGTITVIDAYNMAGGSTGGNLSNSGVVRIVAGKATRIPVNISNMLNKGDMTNNIALKPDDMLYIPPNNSHPFQWSNLLIPLTALSLLGLHM